MKFLKCEILYQGVVMAESKDKARAVKLAKAAADGFSGEVTVNAFFLDDNCDTIERAIMFDRWGNVAKLWLLAQEAEDFFRDDAEQETDNEDWLGDVTE